MNILCSMQQNVIKEAIFYTFYLLLRIFFCRHYILFGNCCLHSKHCSFLLWQKELQISKKRNINLPLVLDSGCIIIHKLSELLCEYKNIFWLLLALP